MSVMKKLMMIGGDEPSTIGINDTGFVAEELHKIKRGNLGHVHTFTLCFDDATVFVTITFTQHEFENYSSTVILNTAVVKFLAINAHGAIMNSVELHNLGGLMNIINPADSVVKHEFGEVLAVAALFAEYPMTSDGVRAVELTKYNDVTGLNLKPVAIVNGVTAYFNQTMSIGRQRVGGENFTVVGKGEPIDYLVAAHEARKVLVGAQPSYAEISKNATYADAELAVTHGDVFVNLNGEAMHASLPVFIDVEDRDRVAALIESYVKRTQLRKNALDALQD